MTSIRSPPAKILGHPAAANLRTLCALRSLVLLGQVGATYYAARVLQWMLPGQTLGLLFSALGVMVAFSWWRSFQRWPVTPQELFIHLCVDIAGFSAIVYFSGGANNPFISYLLVPLCISATTLPWSFTWALTVITTGAYSLLLFHYVPLTAIMAQHNLQGGPNIHILGMWANFVVSALLITYFVFKMASALRQREAELARSRERRLQDEQLLAVATLAAGTAHELGTPLSTMKVVTEDLLDMEIPAPLQTEIAALNQQVDHCKGILQKLVSTARDFSSLKDEEVELGPYAEALLLRWQLLRPGLDIEVDIVPHCRSLRVRLDGTVAQAIINLLNNAADANETGLALKVDCDGQDLVFTVADRGEGKPAVEVDVAEHPRRGLGLGLTLSHATAARYGGRLDWIARAGGGSELQLRLPLARIAL